MFTGHNNSAGTVFCGECGEKRETEKPNAQSDDVPSSTPPEEAPPVPPPPPIPPALTRQRVGNGLTVAALALGIIGVLAGLIPILFLLAWIFGVLAFTFGLIGTTSARRRGSGKRMAIAGVTLGVVAVALGVVGMIIVNDVFTSTKTAVGHLSDPNPSVRAPVNRQPPASTPQVRAKARESTRYPAPLTLLTVSTS